MASGGLLGAAFRLRVSRRSAAPLHRPSLGLVWRMARSERILQHGHFHPAWKPRPFRVSSGVPGVGLAYLVALSKGSVLRARSDFVRGLRLLLLARVWSVSIEREHEAARGHRARHLRRAAFRDP